MTNENKSEPISSGTVDTKEEIVNSAPEREVSADGDAHDDELPIDLEEVTGVDDSWKKVKSKPKLTKMRTLLMLGVLLGIPWFAYGYLGDLAYFFSNWEPIELGSAVDYVRADSTHQAKPQDFKDNTYVHMTGYPVRQISISKKNGMLHSKYLVYQLMGSSVYVQEPYENSKYAKFLSSTKNTFSPDAGVVDVDVKGRLRRFDTGNVKAYAPVRDYFSSNYGVTFCSTLSKTERLKKQAQLGRGGLALQVMPDKSVIRGETDSKVTIKKVIPLKNRNALAIGENNTRFVTTDAGLTWKNVEMPFENTISAVAYTPSSGQIIYAQRGGVIGSEDYRPDKDFMHISQDVEDLIFVDPNNIPLEDSVKLTPADAPALVGVGRQGLIELAFQNREGWLPASIDKKQDYNDILRIGDQLYVAGSNGVLMTRSTDVSSESDWNYAMTPSNVDWYSFLELPEAIVVTGSNGQVARLDRSTPDAGWELWPFDDVPGIEFKPAIRSSAVSGDGNTWVAVGEKGAILNAKRNADGKFGRISAISNTFATYGFLDDLNDGCGPAEALANVAERAVKGDLYDVTWRNGKFYAVGDKGLFMTSTDGHLWQKQDLRVGNKYLRSIRFVDDMHGYIGGEAGTLLSSEDGGKTWQPMPNPPTKRSIFKLITDPSLKDAFVFTGTYGMWGYCYVNGRCFLRSHNQENHYNSLALVEPAKAVNKLVIAAVGENNTIDTADDAFGPDSLHSIIQKDKAIPAEIAAADTILPLKPNYGGGQLALIASTNGTVYRSMDAGYTFVPTPTGLHGDLKRVLLSSDGDLAYAVSVDGEAVRALHGLNAWRNLKMPTNESVKDLILVGKRTAIASNRCIYTLDPTDDAQPQQRACFEQDIRSIAVFGASRVAVETENAVYHLDVATSDQPENLGVSTNTIPKDETAAEPARLMGCDASLWYTRGNALYQLKDGQWHKHALVQKNLVQAFCAQNKLAVVTSDEVRQGVWKLDAELINATGVESAWSMNVGFDPSDARVTRTSDGFWFVTAQSPNADAPLILLSRDGAKWSWRNDRTTDYYAVAQGKGIMAAVGSNGAIALSKNQGLSWRDIKTNTKNTLRDVCITRDGTFGLAVGDAGTVMYTKKTMDYWSRANFELTSDLTSCAIDETDGRFKVYLAGKGGLFYYSEERSLEHIQLIESENFENIESLAALQSGEIIAVGGNYQDPETICEEGFLLEDGETPADCWKTVLILLAMLGFWIYTMRTFIIAIQHRNDVDPDEL